MRWIVGLLVSLAVLVWVLLALFPAPIDPVAWDPAPDPGLSGDFEPNDRLAGVELLLQGIAEGPEDVFCGPDGDYYTGLHDGRILRFTADGEYRELVNTGGRPLGMQLDSGGQLIVADAARGLLSVSPEGEIEVLADSVDGEKMLFVDDLDIAADGTIWFSDASARHDYHQNLYDFLEGRPSGRLLSHDPVSGETRVHIDELFFANGVALGPADDFVLVNETGAGRIQRLWLKGSRAGQRELFHTGLPGTPDNLSFNGSDTFWVAMPALRSGVDALADKPWLRKLLSRLPLDLITAGTPRYSFVVGLGLDGTVRHNLQDTGAGYNNITSANECDGTLFLGSLTMPAVARYSLR